MYLIEELQASINNVVLIIGAPEGFTNTILNPDTELLHTSSLYDVRSGTWVGSSSPVTLVETLHFDQLPANIEDVIIHYLSLLRSLPQDKLKLVLVSLPASLNQAQQTLQELEFLFGEHYLDHTLFINEETQDSLQVWKLWFERQGIENARICQASNVHYILQFLESVEGFTPNASEELSGYLNVNPKATLEEVLSLPSLRLLQRECWHRKRLANHSEKSHFQIQLSHTSGKNIHFATLLEYKSQAHVW
jgi:hypothetical protein